MPSLAEVRVEADSGAAVGKDVWRQPARPIVIRLAAKPAMAVPVIVSHRLFFTIVLLPFDDFRNLDSQDCSDEPEDLRPMIDIHSITNHAFNIAMIN